MVVPWSLESYAMAGGGAACQQMCNLVEARVRVMEYVMEMGVEEVMVIVLAPVLFALPLHRWQHCHPHADFLLEEHDTCIQQGLRFSYPNPSTNIDGLTEISSCI
jgi:hypothetical protein